MKLLIAKALIATSCIAGSTCPPPECSTRITPAHWEEVKGQAYINKKWVKARIRVWVSQKKTSVCAIY